MGVRGPWAATILLLAGMSTPRALPPLPGCGAPAPSWPSAAAGWVRRGAGERQERGRRGGGGDACCLGDPPSLPLERAPRHSMGASSLRLRGGRSRLSKDFWIDPVQHQREPGRARPLPRHMQAELDEKTYNCSEALPHDSREAKDVIAHPENYQFWDPDTGEELDASFLSNRIPQVEDEEAYLEAVKPDIVARRLWDAATVGDTEEIELIAAYLDADANAVDEMMYNFTALHWAALNGHTHTVKLLLSLGANANAQDFLGSTPMHYAADRGHEDVVQALLLGGARPFLDNVCGRTPLHWAEDARVEAELEEERAASVSGRDAAVRQGDAASYSGPEGASLGGGSGMGGAAEVGGGLTFAQKGRNAVRRILRRAMGLMLSEDLKEPVANPVCAVDDIEFVGIDPDHFPTEAGGG